ncbi:hypothetical protein AB0I69_36150 [Streptomyces sp. NPDC050508]|uniref:hypothetical protein n=1 Tax=Streptomyces sp. NPDC050508 TaxID=3155405 RepID=UPI0034221D16
MRRIRYFRVEPELTGPITMPIRIHVRSPRNTDSPLWEDIVVRALKEEDSGYQVKVVFSSHGTANIATAAGDPSGPTLDGRTVVVGTDYAAVPPERHPTDMVFRNYALRPHLTVRQSFGFGPGIHKVPRGEADRRITETLEQAGLTRHADGRPAAISGGEQQLTASARALPLRQRVHEEIRDIRQLLCITAQFVTDLNRLADAAAMPGALLPSQVTVPCVELTGLAGSGIRPEGVRLDDVPEGGADPGAEVLPRGHFTEVVVPLESNPRLRSYVSGTATPARGEVVQVRVGRPLSYAAGPVVEVEAA